VGEMSTESGLLLPLSPPFAPALNSGSNSRNRAHLVGPNMANFEAYLLRGHGWRPNSATTSVQFLEAYPSLPQIPVEALGLLMPGRY
jgi:hypothetical protein